MMGPARWPRVLLSVAVVVGVGGAIARRWLCDDAFISFRYAQNLVAGHGLVFNAEERVEGYTNFLWTLLCAGAAALGIDPVAFGQWAGIACFGAMVLAVARVGRRLLPGDTALLPAAAVGCALHRHLQEFASCGLETASFVLLVVLLLDALLAARAAAHWACGGVLATLLALSRPDGALFGAVGGLCALAVAVRQRRIGPLLAYVLPPLLVGAALLLWKLGYYGALLPNTFYAKSAHDPYPGQGLYYLALYLSTYWVLAPALLVLPVLPWLRPRGRAAWLLPGFGLAYAAFVVWVGGDFMFARFLLPITPVLYLALEWLVRRFLPGAGLLAAAVIGAGTLAWLPHQGLLDGEMWRGVGDERAQYPAERVAAIRDVGRRMGEALAGAPVRVVFFGTQAMLVYEAGFAYAMEGSTGLTDAHLARMQVDQRGRIGHEKSVYADPGYVLARGVHFLLEPYAGLLDLEPWRFISFFGMPATVVRYDRQVMQRLRDVPGVAYTDFERYLDAYLAALPGSDPVRVREDLARFQLYWFAHNDDPTRLGAFQRFLAGR